jgi:hypothetical protein
MTFSDSRPTDLPSALATAPIAARPMSALANTDQQRAIAEVQAAMVIARSAPRDTIRALDLIVQDCTRPGLAERALYSYSRGGTEVTGPSIRLAEAIAQRWGNLQIGIRELEQRPGESLVQAYAWDVESNTRREVTFTVPHVRDTRSGRKELTDARDIYEMTANMGARRLRACILAVIPGDVVDAAVDQVEVTMKTRVQVTPELLKALVEKFAAYGVTKAQIEARIQRHIDAITPALVVSLGKIYNSMKDGMSVSADWFQPEAKPEAESDKAAGVAGLKSRIKGAAPKPESKESAPAVMPAAGEMFAEREPGSEG